MTDRQTDIDVSDAPAAPVGSPLDACVDSPVDPGGSCEVFPGATAAGGAEDSGKPTPVLPRDCASRGCGVPARLVAACRGPRALPAFGVLSFIESSVGFIPIDLAMIPLGVAQRHRMSMIVLVGALGSLLGAIAGYMVGALLMNTVGWWLVGLYGVEESVSSFMVAYDDQGWKALVATGITPLPFTVATVMSGASGMSFPVFVAAAFGVRLMRFAVLGALILLFGEALSRLVAGHSRKVVVAAVIAAALGILALPLVVDF